MTNINPEQIKSLLRFFAATVVGGILLTKLGITADQIPGIVDALAALAGALVALWGIFVHTETNTVAAAVAMPNVVGVTTTNTVAGKALSDAVPSEAVQVAGTPQATGIANRTGPKQAT